MNQPLIPSQGGGQNTPAVPRSRSVSMGLRTRAMLYGILAAAILTGLIALGSRGFHWFDATLIGYAVASIFAIAAVTYKYSFWLARPQTGRYWRRSWQLFFSYANFRRYTALIPTAILDLFSQQFIRRRGTYRWVTHQCIFWGVILSCCITFSLTFGWIRMTLTASGQHLVWFFGFPLFAFSIDSVLGFLIYHALDLTAILLLVGLVLALHRRFHDLSLITVQRFGFDLMPLALLMAIVITGLALTADSTWLRGAYYWYISLTHEVVVVLWLISLPFGKFFHLIERPATVGIELYWRTGEDTEMQKCARCGEEFAPVRFIQDLKKTLLDVGEDYTLREDVLAQQSAESTGTLAEAQATRTLWWQDLCPTCKRVMRAQATLAALAPSGNRFL